MKKVILIILVFVLVAVCLLFPEWVSAVVRSGFEGKMANLQRKLSSFILPVMSVLGLVMAAILAATGNESARSKIWFCLIGSAVGFLAPYIIGWLQGILT